VAQVQKKTFVQALNNACDIPLSQLSSPCIKGDLFFVHIVEDVYLVGLEECNNHLHSWIVLAKGDRPLTHLEVFKTLNLAYNSLDSWRVIPLGRGFY